MWSGNEFMFSKEINGHQIGRIGQIVEYILDWFYILVRC